MLKQRKNSTLTKHKLVMFLEIWQSCARVHKIAFEGKVKQVTSALDKFLKYPPSNPEFSLLTFPNSWQKYLPWIYQRNNLPEYNFEITQNGLSVLVEEVADYSHHQHQGFTFIISNSQFFPLLLSYWLSNRNRLSNSIQF